MVCEFAFRRGDRSESDLHPHTLGLIPEPYDIAIVEGGFGFTTALAVIVTNTGLRDNLDLSYLYPLPDSRTGAWTYSTVSSDFPDGRASRVCPVDFNGDGINDVAVTSVALSDLRVYLGKEDIYTGWDWLSVAGGAYTGLTDVKCGDIDGDGRPDLVTITTQHLGGDRVAWWPNASSRIR